MRFAVERFHQPEDRGQVANTLLVATELKIELGGFDAEFLLDFLSKELGAYYYNQGLRDAQAVFLKRVGELTDQVSELEKPTELLR